MERDNRKRGGKTGEHVVCLKMPASTWTKLVTHVIAATATTNKRVFSIAKPSATISFCPCSLLFVGAHATLDGRNSELMDVVYTFKEVKPGDASLLYASFDFGNLMPSEKVLICR